MELKNAFLLIIIGFCFLIGYSYAEAEVNICNKHFYIDEEGQRHCDEIDGIAMESMKLQKLILELGWKGISVTFVKPKPRDADGNLIDQDDVQVCKTYVF